MENLCRLQLSDQNEAWAALVQSLKGGRWMRLRDARLWAVLLALAFLVLWCVSVGVAYAAPPQDPFPEAAAVPTAERLHAIGVWGWALVGIGFLGVFLSVFLSSRPRRKTRRAPGKYHSRAVHEKRALRPDRTVYASSSKGRYQRKVERRFY